MIRIICRLCGNEKLEDNFYKKRNGKDNRCKQCLSEKARNYYINNIEKERERSRKKWKFKSEEERSRVRTTSRIWSKTDNGIYAYYKQNARKRKIEFKLTKEQFISFLHKECLYCGENAKGIDRLNNRLGYMVDNCATCCAICNIMKRDMSMDYFISHCNKITKNKR